MSAPVLLVLGSGGNIGLSLAKKFSSEGWKVASVARTIKDDIKANSSLALSADFSDPENLPKVFKEVETNLGVPNVVVYNAYSFKFASSTDPFGSISVSEFATGLTVDVTSGYAAAKLAVEGFKKLPASSPKTFIYTGNMMGSLIVPETMSLGSGKNAALYFLEAGAHAYAQEGYHFYFADERMPSGGSVMAKIDGNEHGKAYWALANGKEQGPVYYTFVKGKGYVKFDIDRNREVKSAQVLMKEAADHYGGK